MNTGLIITNVVVTIISSYWWLILLTILLTFLRTPFMKGALGELLVNITAGLFLDKKKYHLFKNITIPTEDGTTQIDHIIVSSFGVFVIETKNMKGWIFGNEHQKLWTQKIYRHTSRFQNPLHQNYKHAQTILSALELASDKLFSLIVFVGDSTFKTAMPENVVYATGFIRFIKSKTRILLSDVEVRKLCADIETGRLKPSIKTHREHVQHVKTIVQKKQERQQQNQQKSCPKCGKPMVLRTARTGENKGKQFLGCSGFPKCKNILSIS